jgi:hypothetical protein
MEKTMPQEAGYTVELPESNLSYFLVKSCVIRSFNDF